MNITTFNNTLFGISGADTPAKDGCTIKKIIILQPLERPTDYVRFAVAFAKYYRCIIMSRVEFCRNGQNRGCSVFDIKCDRKTSTTIFSYGSTSRPNPTKVTDSEIESYVKQFGTDRCEDPDYQPEYHYLDNWKGETRKFSSLEEARSAAALEPGITVSIFANEPYSLGIHFVENAKASGHYIP